LKDHNNKEWVKRSTSLIPAITNLLPLLLAATAVIITITTTYNNKNHESF